MTVKIAITWRRPVTILGNQEGQRFFQEGPKFFEICPILSSYVQHIFPGGAKSFVGGASPPLVTGLTWNLNVCINYFTLPCWLVKNSFVK